MMRGATKAKKSEPTLKSERPSEAHSFCGWKIVCRNRRFTCDRHSNMFQLFFCFYTLFRHHQFIICIWVRNKTKYQKKDWCLFVDYHFGDITGKVYNTETKNVVWKLRTRS
jgi:hypothetical protein